MLPMTSTNHMKRLRSLDNSVANQPLVKRGQLAIMHPSKSQEITVGDTSGVQKARWIYMFSVEERHIVGPKRMARQLPECGQQLGNGSGRTRRVWISGMADNAQHPVFRERTSGPGLLTLRSKPFVRRVVSNVSRIDQGNQDIDIQQEPGHGSSSRS